MNNKTVQYEMHEINERFLCEDIDETQELSKGFNQGISEKAEKLLEDAVIIDACASNLEDYGWRMQSSGLTALNCMVPEPKDMAGETIRKMMNYYQTIQEQEKYILARTADDIITAKKNNKIAVILGAQGCAFLLHFSFEAAVELFSTIGLRIMQLANNRRTFAADGCMTGTDAGLNVDGKRVIAAMEKYSITVDLSQVGRRSTFDIMSICKKPPIFSHSNPAGLFNHPRNISDEQATKCAELGGVVGVSAAPATLWDGKNFPTIDTFIRCIDYYVNLIGIDHVGIGLDSTATAGAFGHRENAYLQRLKGTPDEKSMEYMSWKAGRGLKGAFTDGIESLANFPNIVDKILKHGYSESDAKKILGENWLRVFKDTWN